MPRYSDAGRVWKEHFNRVLVHLGLHMPMRDLAVCASKVYWELVILNLSTKDVLVWTKSPITLSKVINRLKSYFSLAQKEGANVKFLKCRIVQSKGHIAMDQTYNILKMTAACFKISKFLSTNTTFRTDRTVESEIANATLSPLHSTGKI